MRQAALSVVPKTVSAADASRALVQLGHASYHLDPELIKDELQEFEEIRNQQLVEMLQFNHGKHRKGSSGCSPLKLTAYQAIHSCLNVIEVALCKNDDLEDKSIAHLCAKSFENAMNLITMSMGSKLNQGFQRALADFQTGYDPPPQCPNSVRKRPQHPVFQIASGVSVLELPSYQERVMARVENAYKPDGDQFNQLMNLLGDSMREETPNGFAAAALFLQLVFHLRSDGHQGCEDGSHATELRPCTATLHAAFTKRLHVAAGSTPIGFVEAANEFLRIHTNDFDKGTREQFVALVPRAWLPTELQDEAAFCAWAQTVFVYKHRAARHTHRRNRQVKLRDHAAMSYREIIAKYCLGQADGVIPESVNCCDSVIRTTGVALQTAFFFPGLDVATFEDAIRARLAHVMLDHSEEPGSVSRCAPLRNSIAACRKLWFYGWIYIWVFIPGVGWRQRWVAAWG